MYRQNFSEALLSLSVLLWFYTFSVSINSFEARILVIAMLPKTKAWYLLKQINEKD